jgi:NAD-dependent deacetylase
LSGASLYAKLIQALLILIHSTLTAKHMMESEAIHRQKIQLAAEMIRSARYTVALTGAGLSTPSGIPDFRSQGSGLWTKDDPMYVASLSAFRHRPEVFYNWLRPLARDIGGAAPNPAHQALAELENSGYLKAVVTQNIDVLHQRAGSSAVVEVHGSLGKLVCLQCGNEYPDTEYREAFITRNEMPRCRQCDALLKPGIVLFEEMLPADAWAAAEQHFSRADLVLVCGSSLEVGPANTLPLYAVENGARLIINTLSDTYLDPQADLILRADVAMALPAITREVLEQDR